MLHAVRGVAVHGHMLRVCVSHADFCPCVVFGPAPVPQPFLNYDRVFWDKLLASRVGSVFEVVQG